MPEYDKMIDDIVNSQLVIPNSVGSVLKDYVGGYDTVFNKNDHNENAILMVEDPQQPGSGRMIMDVTSEIGKKQKAKAAEYLKRQIEKQLGSKETRREPREESQTDKTARLKRREEDNQISNVGKLMTGTATDMVTLTEYFRDLNPATQKVTRSPDGIEVVYRNPNTQKIESRSISFYTGKGENRKAKTVAQFIESASPLLTGNKDIKTILERGNYDKDAKFNEKLTEDYVAEIDVAEVADESQDMEALDKKLNLAVKDLDFYGEDEGEEGLRAKIKEAFPEFELTITPIDNDEFIIDVAGYDGSVTIEGDFFGISNVEGEREKRKLKAFMKSLYIQKYKKDKGTNTPTNTPTNTETGGNSR